MVRTAQERLWFGRPAIPRCPLHYTRRLRHVWGQSCRSPVRWPFPKSGSASVCPGPLEAGDHTDLRRIVGGDDQGELSAGAGEVSRCEFQERCDVSHPSTRNLAWRAAQSCALTKRQRAGGEPLLVSCSARTTP